ncbi:hypothetical protein BJV85_001507 [Clostridium acetobutylicum]|uniref:hypothetical protein n=1 Tax=Clostridium acetobutylicum TaxID=1488 RepID=UPI000200BDD5|nr:hypothetical protein [Clostridium acetobutylicum]ADZ21429.1 Oligopeptide ABC-type transporter [Clostridium acetobutylicum EA 2018]AEI34408.1 oligopeptide ABC transporter, periplasmic substrate-binding component [Clostridium acetobutylicum DSM 1731]MBC2394786.1 peptide ABC transporter substrate-binding protein [Clostridium acetobutylicum]MBC2586445.1 peptide ABC transporter substrate-binding protein [Clostridium acetobutylicum]NOV88541.1 hypothetical protein [Clostridium acetobutylicum]
MKKWHMMSLIASANVMIFLTACGQIAVNKNTNNFSKTTVQTIKASQPYKVPKLAEKRKDELIVGIEKPDDGKMVPLNSGSVYNQYMWEMMYESLGDVDEKGSVNIYIIFLRAYTRNCKMGYIKRWTYLYFSHKGQC